MATIKKCPSCAAAEIVALDVEGQQTGIANIEGIMAGVKALGLTSKADIKRELVVQARLWNYVPSSKEEEYAKGLLEEYRHREVKRQA